MILKVLAIAVIHDSLVNSERLDHKDLWHDESESAMGHTHTVLMDPWQTSRQETTVMSQLSS